MDIRNALLIDGRIRHYELADNVLAMAFLDDADIESEIKLFGVTMLQERGSVNGLIADYEIASHDNNLSLLSLFDDEQTPLLRVSFTSSSLKFKSGE